MVLGIFLLKKKYCMREYASICIITAGICICTLASSKMAHSKENNENLNESLVGFIWWIVGNFIVFIIKNVASILVYFN